MPFSSLSPPCAVPRRCRPCCAWDPLQPARAYPFASASPLPRAAAPRSTPRCCHLFAGTNHHTCGRGAVLAPLSRVSRISRASGFRPQVSRYEGCSSERFSETRPMGCPNVSAFQGCLLVRIERGSSQEIKSCDKGPAQVHLKCPTRTTGRGTGAPARL